MAAMALVDRLVRLYWPRWLHDYYASHNPWKVVPIDHVHEKERPFVEDYDERRVAFFLDQLTRGLELDPITVACSYDFYLVDGHHRYAAYVIYGARHIPMTFSGPVAFDEWLRGKRNAWPFHS